MVETNALVSPEEAAGFALEHLPDTAGWDHGATVRRKHVSKCSQLGGGQAVAGKLPSVALALLAKSLKKKKKKLLSFQILAKEEFFSLEDGHENTE